MTCNTDLCLRTRDLELKREQIHYELVRINTLIRFHQKLVAFRVQVRQNIYECAFVRVKEFQLLSVQQQNPYLCNLSSFYSYSRIFNKNPCIFTPPKKGIKDFNY